MPSKPDTEPTLEELSAYLDHELDDGDQARVAGHVAGCADCQSRLDDLRQTVYAVRGLPQETPPKRFTIPAAQPKRALNWVPIGWIGGVAAAMIFVIVAVTQFHFPGGGGTASTASGAGSTSLALQAPAAGPNKGVAGSGTADQSRNYLSPQVKGSLPNLIVVSDPSNSSRQLIPGTDAPSYNLQGTMRVQIILRGDPSPSTDVKTQGLSVVLIRNGYGVTFRNLSGSRAYGGPPTFTGTMAVADLSQPAPGNYSLVATWIIPDGSGRVMQASVPVAITGS